MRHWARGAKKHHTLEHPPPKGACSTTNVNGKCLFASSGLKRFYVNELTASPAGLDRNMSVLLTIYRLLRADPERFSVLPAFYPTCRVNSSIVVQTDGRRTGLSTPTASRRFFFTTEPLTSVIQGSVISKCKKPVCAPCLFSAALY